MDLSNSVKYGTIIWTALSAVIDDIIDTNRDPNSKPMSDVRVTFTASTPRIVIQDPFPVTIFLQSINARTNEQGTLVGPDNVEGIKLVATDNPMANPVNFTYRVNVSGLGVPITFDISVPSDGIVDLSFLMPVVSSAGKVLAPERGPQGIEGPPPELAIGTVKPTDASSKAAAYFRPNPIGGHFLDLDLPIGPQGAKGDPGGWTATPLSATQHLDTVTTPGLYYQPSSSAASPANGYPANMPQDASSTRGVLEVFNYGGAVIQRYTNVGRGFFANSAQYPRVTYSRTSGTIWSNWTTQTSQRVDNTVGKVVYTWDDTTNKELMIYGDTGWRSFPLNEGVTGKILIRRIGQEVTCRFIDVIPNGSVRNLAIGPPTGFIPADGNVKADNFATGFMVVGGDPLQDWHRVDIYRYAVRWQGPLRSGNNAALTAGMSGYLSYLTDDAWPTTLPGVPV